VVAWEKKGEPMTGVIVNYGLNALPRDGTSRAITIGKFDGVHRGHQKVIDQLLSVAGEAEPTVITFDRHPSAILNPGDAPEAILSEAQKIELLEKAGIARVIVLAFDHELSSLTHQDFSDRVLVDGLGASMVLVGADFRYGHGGGGTIDTLRAEGAKGGFLVEVVADLCEEEGQRVSSTMIRQQLEKGEASATRALLGRYHFVRGEVAQGFQRGRALGYPTANLSINIEGYVPGDGVYATFVTHAGIRYDAATSIGVNPTFGDLNDRTIESHLMNSTLDLYGEVITVEFVEFVRGMKKFDSPEALSTQMGLDESQIAGILSDASRA
jgi:riboflavin kinase / FMN adenylyltransferase